METFGDQSGKLKRDALQDKHWLKPDVSGMREKYSSGVSCVSGKARTTQTQSFTAPSRSHAATRDLQQGDGLATGPLTVSLSGSHSHTHAQTHTHTDTHTHAHTHRGMHRRKHIDTLTQANAHSNTHAQNHGHTHKCTNTCTRTHTHTHTHTYERKSRENYMCA